MNKEKVLKKIHEAGKCIIEELSQGKALYIINKQMTARVLFYFKDNTYFLSDEIKLKNIDYIDKSNSDEIVDIYDRISNQFNNTGMIQKSALIENIDSVIDEYFPDAYILLVDRIKDTIEDDISMEAYNKVIVFTGKNSLDVTTINNKIMYKSERFNVSKNSSSKEMMNTIFSHIIDGSYPVNNDDLLYNELSEDYFTTNPGILFFTVIAEVVVYCKLIGFYKEVNYGKDSIYLLSDILAIAEDDNIDVDDYDSQINDIVANFNETLNVKN